jgi:hypothetical protein
MATRTPCHQDGCTCPVGSLPTCPASTALNALLDRHPDAVDAAELMRWLMVGYVGPATAVVLRFLFLSTVSHRQNTDERA